MQERIGVDLKESLFKVILHDAVAKDSLAFRAACDSLGHLPSDEGPVNLPVVGYPTMIARTLYFRHCA